MKTVATQAEKQKLIYDCLVDGLPFFPGYGVGMDYTTKAYKAAIKTLKARMPEDRICREDVWAEIVANGGDLVFIDQEDDDKEIGRLNLANVEKHWDAIPHRFMAEYISENYDSNTTDCIIQTLIFGEIVYG